MNLPPSARDHPEWWSNSHYYARWTESGWYASPRLSEGKVRFSKRVPTRGRPRSRTTAVRSISDDRDLPAESRAGLILLGCVSQKLDWSAPARDLYRSTLWVGRKAYAERTGKPWRILSAEHGVIHPDAVIAPYDRSLEAQTARYRREWSDRTAGDILQLTAQLETAVVEIHAGSAYIDSGLGTRLEHAGITVDRPLRGMRIGEQLAWYAGSGPAHDTRPKLVVEEPDAVAPMADHVHRIASDYASGVLGESWGELPETRVFRLPNADPVDTRTWLTFICALDRARDAEALWSAGLRAWESDPWLFTPTELVQRSFTELTEGLRASGLSQRHGPDAFAWAVIADTLAGADCPDTVRAVLDGGPVDASALRSALNETLPGGTSKFPLLSGPKIGPMWIRIMAYPGGAEVTGVDVIPVAVDTHVQRATEMLGLVSVRSLDDRHRKEIEEVWFRAVRESGPFGGPNGIDGTAAALDPALWVLGKNGCSVCERAMEKRPIGSICELCELGRVEVT